MDRKIITGLCCSIMFLYAVSLTIISPLIIEISSTFSLSISQSGILFTVLFIGFVSFILFGGILSDHFGKKTVLTLSLAFFSLVLFLFPLAPDFYVACIIMFFIGGFGGIMESMASALASDVNPINTSFYVNLVQIFFGVGAIIGPITVGLVVSSGIGWKYYFYALGVISIIITSAFGMKKMPNLPQTEKIRWRNFKGLITNKKFIIICFCMILYTGSEVGAWGWMCTFLDKIMRFSILKSSISVAVFWSSMTIGRILCGYLLSKFSLRKIIIFLAFMSSIVTLLSVFTNSEVFIWVVIILMGLAYSSLWPFIASFGSRNSNAPSGTVFAFLVGSGGIGGMLIPYFMGFVGELTTMSLSMIIPSIMLFAVGMLFITFSEKKVSGNAEP